MQFVNYNFSNYFMTDESYHRKKIAIFQKDLSIGGIQRSLLNLLTYIDLSYYDVDLFLFAEPELATRNDLKNINVHILKPLPYFNRVVPFEMLMKTYYYDLPKEKYDIAIDYNSYSNECALCVLQMNAARKIMWIHNDVETEYKNMPKYRILWHFFKSKFKYYDEFAAVSNGIVEPFAKKTGINENRISVIPNSINTALIFKKAKEKIDFDVDSNLVNFIFVGRFTHQKGIDLTLIEFSKALKKRQDIHLYLLGDGEELPKIKSMIKELNLSHYVTILHAVENPYPYMAKMDALILTSRHEGQGMVLWEAKALGLDIIFSHRLEKYNPELTGTYNIARAIIEEEHHVKVHDALDGYNLKIKNALYELIENN